MLEKINFHDSVPSVDREFLANFYTHNQNADWQLSFENDIYCVSSDREKLTLTLDFRTGNYQHRNHHPAKEPLVKAIKIKQKLPATLIDATPGVLKDALMLAGRGVAITAIERNPLLYIMVRQALSVLETQPSIDYHFGDASDRLAEFSAELIYLDPMYPPKKKNAQVKKDMQVLHTVVGADDDADGLFSAAQQQNTRIVVKRPSYAEPLANQKPSFVSQTGATRFDVYLPHKVNDT